MKRWALVFVFASALLAADIDIGEYRYYPREKLAKNLEKIYRKHREKYPGVPLKVKVVDEFVKIWKKQDIEGWVRFDTKYFRCLIRRTNGGIDRRTGLPEGITLLRRIENYRKTFLRWKKYKQILEDPKKRWMHYGLITIYGRMVKSEKWGTVREEARENGVEPEYFILEVDKIVVPRERFFKLFKK